MIVFARSRQNIPKFGCHGMLRKKPRNASRNKNNPLSERGRMVEVNRDSRWATHVTLGNSRNIRHGDRNLADVVGDDDYVIVHRDTAKSPCEPNEKDGTDKPPAEEDPTHTLRWKLLTTVSKCAQP